MSKIRTELARLFTGDDAFSDAKIKCLEENGYNTTRKLAGAEAQLMLLRPPLQLADITMLKNAFPFGESTCPPVVSLVVLLMLQMVILLGVLAASSQAGSGACG